MPTKADAGIHSAAGGIPSDFLRYDGDGEKCYSANEEGEAANLPVGSGDIIESIAVDSVEGNVFVGSGDGSIRVWSQS